MNIIPHKEPTGYSSRMTPNNKVQKLQQISYLQFQKFFMTQPALYNSLLHKDINKYSLIRSHNTEQGSVILPLL